MVLAMIRSTAATSAFDMRFLLVALVPTSAAPIRLPSGRGGRLW
jgi:hypothetical protein